MDLKSTNPKYWIIALIALAACAAFFWADCRKRFLSSLRWAALRYFSKRSTAGSFRYFPGTAIFLTTTSPNAFGGFLSK